MAAMCGLTMMDAKRCRVGLVPDMFRARFGKRSGK